MKIQFIPYEDGSKQKAVEGAENILNLDFAKPKPIGQVLPDWYKHLSAFIDRPLTPGAGTAKACRPLHEYLHYGYVLPLWADYIFEKNEEQNIVAISKTSYGEHPSVQTGFVLDSSDKYQGLAVKFINPWIIKTPPGYSCLFMAPFYNFEEKFTIAPAIVNTDLYEGQVHLPAFVNKHAKIPFVLEMGYPLVHIIPFKRDNWESKITNLKDLVKTKAFKGFRYIMQNKWFWQYKKFAGASNKFK